MLPTPRRENKTVIVDTVDNEKEVVVEIVHGRCIDENESNEASNVKVDEVDKNKCGEASGTTRDEVTKGESDEVPQVCVFLQLMEQVTETPERQLSAAPETAERIVNVQDETEPATQLDENPLDETQPTVQPKAPPENSTSRAVRLVLEGIRFRKKTNVDPFSSITGATRVGIEPLT